MSATGARALFFIGYPILVHHHMNLKLTLSSVLAFQFGKYTKSFTMFKRQGSKTSIPQLRVKLIMKILKPLINSISNLKLLMIARIQMYTFVLTIWDSNYTMCSRQFSDIWISTSGIIIDVVFILSCRLSLNQSKSEFLHIGLLKQLFKVSDFVLVHSKVMSTPSDSACNLYSSLTVSDHISSVSKSYFLPESSKVTNRQTLDSSTAETIATSLIHSKEGFCNLFLNLPRSQPDRLQLVLNSAARAISKTRLTLISPALKCL